MPMKKHPHPGRIVRQDFLEPLGLTVTEAAQVLGVARQTINNLVNEKVGISTGMAVRLSKAFGPSPDMWYASRPTMICLKYDRTKLALRATSGPRRRRGVARAYSGQARGLSSGPRSLQFELPAVERHHLIRI